MVLYHQKISLKCVSAFTNKFIRMSLQRNKLNIKYFQRLVTHMDHENRTINIGYLVNVLQEKNTQNSHYHGLLTSITYSRPMLNIMIQPLTKKNLVNVKPVRSFHRIHDSEAGQDRTVENHSPQSRQPRG